MEPNVSTLLIIEIILPLRNLPLQMALWDVQIMTVLGGRERTQSDWEVLVASVDSFDAGAAIKFEIVHFWHPPRGSDEGILEIMRRA